MLQRCVLYYITDRTQFSGPESQRVTQLLQKIKEATAAGVDYIQLRERDLTARQLENLAHSAVDVIRTNSQPKSGRPPTRLLINSRTDVALASQADGVHLRSDDITVADVRKIWAATKTHASSPRPQPVIAVSCHTPEEVQAAKKRGADFAVFGPVFGKSNAEGSPPAGLSALHEACQANIPVLALGGVTLDNAPACLQAGAAGVAAIRLFQQNDISELVRCLRRPRL